MFLARFTRHEKPLKDIRRVLKWIQGKSPEEVRCVAGALLSSRHSGHSRQVNAERDRIMREFESVAAKLWNSGRCEEWLDGARPHVKEVRALRCSV